MASLAGMLLPSVTITCLLAALVLRVERVAGVQAALRGVIPAAGPTSGSGELPLVGESGYLAGTMF